MRNAAKKKVSFEEAMEQLEGVVKELEGGDISLDSLLEKYTQGVKLSKFCLEELNQTEAAMDKMVREHQGEVVETALEIEGE